MSTSVHGQHICGLHRSGTTDVAATRTNTSTSTNISTSTSTTGSTNTGAKNKEKQSIKPSMDSSEVKEFVIIGNGPSGICLSFYLSGNSPYYQGVSDDEFLHSRLMVEPHLSLIEQDLEFLSDGLEGRSNNPVALLLDYLQRPQADLGRDLPSLLEWRYDPRRRVDHVVLGRGKPGGVWQTLDGTLKTVSLGTWMQLPNFSIPEWEQRSTALIDRRTSVCCVAQYYSDYVETMGLQENFRNHTVVTRVKQVDRPASVKGRQRDTPTNNISTSAYIDVRRTDAPAEDVFSMEEDELSSECSSTTNYSPSPFAELDTRRCDPTGRTGRGGSVGRWSSSPECSCLPEVSDVTTTSAPPSAHTYSRSFAPTPDMCLSWDPIINPSLFSCHMGTTPKMRTEGSSFNSLQTNQRNRLRNEQSLSNSYYKSPCGQNQTENDPCSPLFEVTGYEVVQTEEGKQDIQHFTYLTKNVVLATGLDLPNRLNVPGEDLSFVTHSLRDLENTIKSGQLTPNSDPIMIVGAGLSAADAIICAQGYNIPIVHVFRRSVDDPQLIFQKLPVKLYPEYHNVHNMMAEGSVDDVRRLHGQTVEREHPRYRAFAKTDVRHISTNRLVELCGPDSNTTIQVSNVVVLIGASPRLDFLQTSAGSNLGRIPDLPLDKNNPIDIDVYTHQSVNVPGLFAMGPLVGDNFVRFLQGGALAIASFAHKHQHTSKHF